MDLPLSGRELFERLTFVQRRDVLYIHKTLQSGGFECYLVGGCVRDLILERQSSGDIDLTTNATPRAVQALFPRTVPTGIRHGTITVLIEKRHYELTTYRAESKYSDARRPDRIHFAKTLKEDLLRRDFTMNAIALEPKTKELVDLHEGFSHIQQKRICTIGRPKDRFFEDGLRPIRACRFLATLEFSLDEKVEEALCDPEVQKRTAQVAVERFSDELWKGFQGPKPSAMIRALEKSHLINIFIYESFRMTQATPQSLLEELSSMKEGYAEYKMALWWMGIGIQKKSGVETLAKVLKFSNHKTKRIVYYQKCIAYKNGNYRPQGFLWRIFSDASPFVSAFELKRSKQIAEPIPRDISDPLLQKRIFLSELKQGLKREASSILASLPPDWETKAPYKISTLQKDLKELPLSIGDLAIRGEELIKRGYYGRSIGEKLEELLALVLIAPQINKRELLLNRILQETQTRQ